MIRIQRQTCRRFSTACSSQIQNGRCKYHGACENCLIRSSTRLPRAPSPSTILEKILLTPLLDQQGVIAGPGDRMLVQLQPLRLHHSKVHTTVPIALLPLYNKLMLLDNRLTKLKIRPNLPRTTTLNSAPTTWPPKWKIPALSLCPMDGNKHEPLKDNSII